MLMDFDEHKICGYCGGCCTDEAPVPVPNPDLWRMLVCEECGHVELFMKRVGKQRGEGEKVGAGN